MMTQKEFNNHYKDFLTSVGVGNLDMRSVMKLKGVNDDEFNEKIGNAVGTFIVEQADKDVKDFLNAPENNKEPHEMGDTHEYLKGGLSYDKDEGFKAFNKKQEKNK